MLFMPQPTDSARVASLHFKPYSKVSALRPTGWWSIFERGFVRVAERRHSRETAQHLRLEIDRKPYVVRVMVNETASPPRVVTVYRTSKIEKYWRTT
ncbi:MAG: hypothetical protein ACREXM_20840 [Gammaproteobacteria bacterium]